MNTPYLFLLQILCITHRILCMEYRHHQLQTILGNFVHNKNFPNPPTSAVPNHQHLIQFITTLPYNNPSTPSNLSCALISFSKASISALS